MLLLAQLKGLEACCSRGCPRVHSFSVGCAKSHVSFAVCLPSQCAVDDCAEASWARFEVRP